MNTLTRMLKLFSPARRTRSAALIRGIAGMPVGATQSRRGTVLVLVIGALALISVITLVYATIGQGDRRSGASSVRKANTADTVDAIAKHIKGVIADGVFSTTVQSGPGVTPPILVRTAADYPFTDPYRISVVQGGPTGPNYVRRFNPTGSYSEAMTGGSRQDPRVQSTPFLAASVPTSITPPAISGHFDDFTRFHDWLHISNLSPDGRFVNLWNLAPMINGQRFSGIDAKSGMTLSGPVGNPSAPFLNGSNQVVSELSYDLSLYNATGQPTDVLSSGGTADPNIPAHWSHRQQWMFRPSTGPMFSPTSNVGGHQPNSPGDSWYAPYQYCDTDGDGMFDSRWFELVDATDPNNPVSLLPRDDRFRWFVAARVVDLSGMVNVNTATDFKEPAQKIGTNEVTKFGATPADIDLRRLFLMDDFYHQFGAGYGALQRPVYPNLEDDYAGYNQNQNAVGRNVGDRAYAALRLALRQNGQGVVPVGTNLANPLGGAIAPFTGDTRYTYFHILGGYASSSYARVGGVAQFDSSARFGSADLKELLTYWTVNNPGSLSRLEQTTGSRFDAVNGGSAATDGYDPLRSNRDLATERGGNDDLENNGLGNGLADADAMARSMFDVRHYITPLSGARPLRSGIVPAGAKFELKTSVDERIDAIAALKKAANATAASRDAGKLLIGYLDGLAPYASRARSYGGDPILNTLAYGGLAERALRAAAAMTANLVDSYDTDNIPSAYTLLIDNDKRNAVQSDTLRFPWWSEAGASGKLDAVDPAAPTIIRLARSSANGDVVQASLGAINVYGIEAQPFITQVVSLCMYTDTPANAASPGDDEWNGNPGPNFDPITISGVPTSPDVLGQIIAFQITNPFDVDIDLSKQNSATGSRLPDNDFTDFYLEFGGDLFKLAKVVASGVEAVTLRAGETRVFYAMNKTEQAMLADWQNIDPAVTLDTLRNYIAAQLGVEAAPTSSPGSGELLTDGRLRPILIQRMDPTSGQLSAPQNLLGGSTESKSHILLWRALRTAAEQSLNLKANDMLCDHLRDPGPAGGSRPPRATLDRQLSASNMQVANTQAGDETSATPLDNTGFTVVTWGSIRRHDDPAAGPASVPLGGLPAYCVEAKWGTIPLKNVTKIATTGLNSLTKADFTGNIWSDTTFNGLITRLSSIAAASPPVLTNVIVPEITKRPEDRSGESMPANADVPPRTFDKLYPKIAINNKKFEGAMPNGYGTVSTLRVADLLMPLGISPMTDPGIPVDPNDPGAQHLALSEALGLALNYSSPPTSDVNWAPLYEKYGDWLTGSSDRGNLVLDRFAPFEDASGNGVFDPNSDQPRAPGIPLALNVMNIFTVTPQEMGNLTQATPGLININTAPPAVIQLFPLLSPTTEPGVWTAFKTSAGLVSGFTVPEPSSAPGAGDGTDIASTVIGHRDKLPMLDRDGRAISFVDGAGVSPFGPSSAWEGRRTTTNIAGLRETPGWGSVAEMMTLIDRTGANGAPGNNRVPTKDQVDYLGYDTFPSGLKGMAASLVKDTSANPPTANQIDKVKDDWEEKLQIAAAAMSSGTVRSDMFAVWFVVQGYQKSDTEGLKPEDVLTPSVAKRYLMVIDRSNVTRKGEQPRVVLFTEVPL